MIFQTFDPTDIVAGRIQSVSTGLWSDGETEWSAFYTSSAQDVASASQFEPLNGLYYTNVYDAPTGSANADIYFALTYGHYAGSGSSIFDTNTSNGSLLFPTKAIYNQYRNLLLTPGDIKFTFASASVGGSQGEVDSDDVYVINFRGNKVKDQLDPGQFEITLWNNNNAAITLIDDSKDNPSTAVQTGGHRYNIIRGTLAAGAAVSNNYEGFGSFYPSLGLVVLNPSVIAANVGLINGFQLNNPTSSLWNGNFARMPNLLYEAIRVGATSGTMKARVTEYVPARHYFVRVKNQELNYSNNPTFVITADDSPASSQDIGKLRFSDFYTDPKVYVTTVGLYNDSNDLVAVAKLSQPTLKDFTNELLIRVRLDF
jgi:hypothetical protein